MKKAIGVYLLLQEVIRGGCLFLSLKSEESSLPIVVLITSVLLIAGAMYMVVLTFLDKARLRQLSRFFVVLMVVTVFNIVFMFFQPVEMIPTDSWVTGNLFDLLMAGIILFYLTRQKYYIRAKYVSNPVQPQQDNQTASGQKARPTV